MPDTRNSAGLGMADGHHEIGTREDVQLAELHRLGIIQIAGGSQDREEVVVVTFQFWPLVR